MTIKDVQLVLEYDKFYTYITNKKYIEVDSTDAPGQVIFQTKDKTVKTKFDYALDDGVTKQILNFLKK